jgi:DNA translocase FtsK/SpoIIIE-like protein
MAALPKPTPEVSEFPDPLEFFAEDFIHPDNQQVIEAEQRRWRLLGFWERLKLQRYTNSLARQLRKARYYSKLQTLYKLRKQYKVAREQYGTTPYISDPAKAEAREYLVDLVKHARVLKGELADLHPTFELWRHYAGWLDYERQNRKDLKAEEKRERQNRKDMRQESKYLERIIYKVWRYTDDCHHTEKAKAGKKEKTRIPKFERVVIKPDAHWFYLRTVLKLPIIGYLWRLPEGVTTQRLQDEEVVENLRAAVKRQVEWFWTDQNQLVLKVARLDRPDSLPKNVQWRDAMKFFPAKKADAFPYTIGAKESHKYHWLYLSTDTNILVAGTQGSGKSNLVNGIIGTFLSTHSPRELRLVLIDMKGGIEFTHWKEVPHLLWEMANDVDEVKPVLTKLVAIMRRRQTLLAAVKAKDIAAYNARVDEDQRLERVVVCIDEMSNFVGLGALTEDIHNLIMLLVSLGRALGISMILCTQHPEVRVIPGRIKTNIPVRLCGWMPTISASQIVLDTPDAAHIAKLPGRFAFRRGMEMLYIQCPEMPDVEIEGVVSSARQAYPDVDNDLRDLKDTPTPKAWNEQRVIKAALDWTEGQLSADKLHEMLGEESPGERTLRKLAQSIKDEFKAMGELTNQEDGAKYVINRRGKAYILQPKKAPEAGITDTPPIMAEPEALSVSPSVAAAD